MNEVIELIESLDSLAITNTLIISMFAFIVLRDMFNNIFKRR